MKNQAYSQLYKKYRSLVETYNTYVECIIKTKFEMDYLWKYKKDYPADWKMMAEKLTDSRKKTSLLKSTIREIKKEMRRVSSDHPQK
jgi:hypothetical protein